MKRLMATLIGLLIFLFPVLALAAGQIFGGYSLTGASGSVKSLNHLDPNPNITTDVALSSGDIFIACVTTGSAGSLTGIGYHYVYDADSSATDDSLKVIQPTSNSGNGRWILCTVYGIDLQAPQSTTGQYIQLLEGSGGGTNYVRLQAPDAITSNATSTLPGGIPTVLEKVGTGGPPHTASLNADEVMGRLVTNRGETANLVLSLPTAAEGMNFIGVNISASYTMSFDPAANDKIYRNGTAQSDGYKITLGAAIGTAISCFTFTTDGTNYDWICTGLAGTITDGGA